MKKVLIIISIVAMVSSLSSAQLAGYWKFDEASGSDVLDSSGNGKNGILFSADSANFPTRITGYSGNALLFNQNTTGFSNYNKVEVALSGTEALSNLGEAFTIAMWVRRDVVNLGVYYPGIIYTNAYEIDLATNPDAFDTDRFDNFYCDLNSSWQISLEEEAEAQKVLGSWYHFAITYDGHNLRKYVNGICVNTITAPTSYSISASTNLSIAARGTGEYLQGALDDVAIWSGKYLVASEVEKLANGTSTPLTAVESDEYVPPVYYLETNLFTGGWAALWSPEFNWSVSIVENHPVWNGYWHFPEPNSQQAIVPEKWYVKNDSNYADIPANASLYGVQWIDSSWNGREPNMTVMAAYITGGMVLGQKDWGGATNPAYFKTSLRIAAANANGASVRVTAYKLSSDTVPAPANYATLMTYLDEVEIPLDFGNHIWKNFVFTLPKPAGYPRIWFEIALVGGDENTVLFIDGLRAVSDVTATYKVADIDKDSKVDFDDVNSIAYNWLDRANVTLVDPRGGGLLTNGDFSADMLKVLSGNQVMNPTGWTFTGQGNYGIANSSKRGRIGWYYGMANRHPVGGDVSAYTTDMFAGDPDGVLEQTASANAVAGQTYYAMGYVMSYDYTSNGNGDWYGWRDTATMEIAIDGVIKKTVSRRLSRSIWRPIYTSYTALPEDAGKPIKIRFSYANTYTSAYTESGTMYVGYAYLGTTVPNEYPEKRPNLLANGAFEDLSAVTSYNATAAAELQAGDNKGAWFVSGMPNIFPNWIYEVPAGYDLNNQGGMWSCGYYASPVPSPGLNDIVAYTSGTFVLGQIVGALTAGTTYYLDTACGVLVEPQTWGSVPVTWPSPAPTLHIELWRIPSGVTDPAVIHTGVTTSQPGYTKIAYSDVVSTGDIKPDDRKWQTIGTTYTATSSDTNVYVRVYGTNPITVGTTFPHFVFSDVYLSTQKRKIAGGTLINNPGAGLQYDVLGPYNCYQATLMGYTAPAIDINGDCIINFVDFSVMADEWLEVGVLN
ncbi:MAG: hypothetical protein A2Y10_00305 [Planctomycetes bacterium GWF2_41_51]|nr:MAG: hypothetical protein A2Y10_00305 [Planctomycetes bacterium GWF2_41_51]